MCGKNLLEVMFPDSTHLITKQEMSVAHLERKLDGVLSNVFWDLFISAAKENKNDNYIS